MIKNPLEYCKLLSNIRNDRLMIIEKDNNDPKEIGTALKKSDNILLFPHIHPDGDAIGSATALYLALKKLNKKVKIFFGEDLPDNLSFMAKGLEDDIIVNELENIEDYKMGILIDCGSQDRIGIRNIIFENLDTKIAIDHHSTSKRIFDMNIILPDRAATAEIIYEIIKEMGVKIDKGMATRIFAGILTDTGSFRYSNATKESHEIAADLYDTDFCPSDIAINIYEMQRIEKFRLEAKAMEKAELLCEGKFALTYVTKKMLEETGAYLEETSIIVPKLRSIKGVEVASLLKEVKDDEIKVSLRSKNTVDVAKIAEEFGGGGHKRAAGFTYRGKLEDALDELRSYIENKVNFYE